MSETTTIGEAGGPDPSVGAPPTSLPPIPPRAGTVTFRFLWFVAVPFGLAAVATRLVPAAGHYPGSGLLARIVADSPLAVGIVLFVLFSALSRYWRWYLPGGRSLQSPAHAGSTAPVKLTVRQAASFGGLLVLAAAAALLLRGSLIETFRVQSSSMLPNLLPFDRVVANKTAYGLRLPLGPRGAAALPKRGDVVVFRAPEPSDRPGPSEIVKRVVGLPGDTITMKNGHAEINGWMVPTCDAGTYIYPSVEGGALGRLLVEFLGDRTYLTVHTSPFFRFDQAYLVKPGEVFVLGDNRSQSIDSRAWGFGQGAGVPLDHIDGRLARVIGGDRDGVIDWSRVFEPLGLDVPLPGTDASPLRAGIEACLKNRPKTTWPPARR